MEIDEIHRLVQQGRYEFSFHAQQERLDEDLDVREVEEVIARSEILEQYPTDPRGESCLVLGYARGRPMHAVVGWAGWKEREERALRIITLYVPRPPKWEDPRTRGERR